MSCWGIYVPSPASNECLDDGRSLEENKTVGRANVHLVHHELRAGRLRKLGPILCSSHVLRFRNS